jgi:hypothetical protein
LSFGLHRKGGKSEMKKILAKLLPILLVFTFISVPVVPVKAASADTTVYITKTGSKYHSAGCKYLKKSKIETTLGAALDSGYEPCSVYKPPASVTDDTTAKAGTAGTKSNASAAAAVKAAGAKDKSEITVYVTKTGKKYHRDGCSALKKSKIAVSLEDAEKSYSPCSKCNPPQ